MADVPPPEVVEEAMKQALASAQRHHPHPNPRVGAVLFAPDGSVAGRGAHVAAGGPHAEVHALEEAGARARGGTMVVTLEPCNHVGRTPPCTEALIAAGVARVIVGARDPDPRVAGAGFARLRQAGIEVEGPTAQGTVEAGDPGYFHQRRTRRSRMVHKAALTLDGQISAVDGSSRWITSVEARADAHRQRAEMDAVMVGAGTVFADDPRLDVRLDGYEGRQPRPVVIAGSRPLPSEAQLWGRRPLVFAPGPLAGLGDAVVVPGNAGAVDLVRVAGIMAERGLFDVLVEGGAALSAGLWDAGLIDAGIWYLAGLVAGGIGRGVFDRPFATLGAGRKVEITEVRRLGPDLRIDWVPTPI
jgi:diaminohydroxyphosphoribosylaminopyrimidine deaminase/5-amino-6-(5-phosphoribosylamino)uracil reductase